MRFANDEFGKRVHILKTLPKTSYFCPSCGEKLVLRKGKIREHHFAHQRNGICSDSWHYDMSLWHTNWQNRFPEETQEIVKKHDGKTHRADILIEETKTVIEFQHSPLSSEEFNDRNHFFNVLGYKVIWVFDYVELFENDYIEELPRRDNVWKWHSPKPTFDNFEFKKENVEIFFQLQNDVSDNEDVQRYLEIIEKTGIDDAPGYDLEAHYRLHKDDEGWLIRIVWVSEEGFDRFASERQMYTNEAFVNSYSNIVKKRATIHLEDLYDELLYVRSLSHSALYFGCPISETHLSSNSDLDLHPSEYKRIMPCCNCEYSDQDSKMMCRKRVHDLKIPETATITDYKKFNGFLTEVSYENEGNKVTKKLVPLKMKGITDTIPALWEKEKPAIATFRNIKSGIYVRMTNDPSEQLAKYKRCYGKMSNDQYSFRGESCEIYYADHPYWILVWSKR